MNDNKFEQDPLRMKKYHEGWGQHQPEGKKVTTIINSTMNCIQLV